MNDNFIFNQIIYFLYNTNQLEKIILTITSQIKINNTKQCHPLNNLIYFYQKNSTKITIHIIIYLLSYKEKKDLLLILVRGLFVCGKVKELIGKTIQDQKDIKYFEKQKNILQREVDAYDSIIKEGKSSELDANPERRKEFNKKRKEIIKYESESKKRKIHQTEMLGVDAEDREYWIFAPDKDQIYVREQEDNKDKWGTYSTKQQIEDLLNVLIDKGVHEKRLKAKLIQVSGQLRLADPANSPTESRQKQEVLYKDRISIQKKKQAQLIIPKNASIQKVLSEITNIEREYTEFFAKRGLEWDRCPPRMESWRKRGLWLTKVAEVRKWGLIFYKKSMNPYVNSNIEKPIKAAIRNEGKYDFSMSSISEYEEEVKSGDLVIEKNTENTRTLKGIFWKELGQNTYKKWVQYLRKAKNSNELMLCCLLYQKLLDSAISNINEVEAEYNRKAGKTAVSLSSRNAGAPIKEREWVHRLRHQPSPAQTCEERKKPSRSKQEKWNETCYICGDGGKLMCCETCPNVAHPECLMMSKAPEEDWQCESCIIRAQSTRQTRSQAQKIKNFQMSFHSKSWEVKSSYSNDDSNYEIENDSSYYA